ncbi:MAG: nucleoside phosphorylase [Bacteroidia bacterium]|nr:nucleoside phosphorylase [Bacteroidia bacterium]NNC85030.1 nucleoside phosphorylase [Bacteroidia bacterium]NNM15171.1 nucleoside phosphorylase [Bacteroidia bacterium]
MKQIAESELILNDDGSLYHINLLPEDISDTIINVGDPDRVLMVSSFFDKIEVKKQKREFVTHTGTYKGKRITVISTGIGTDNIDIVYNELDALVNIDLNSRTIKPSHTSLNLIRIGTSGSLQADIPSDAFVLSTYGLGLDGLMNYYECEFTQEEQELNEAFGKHYPTNGLLPKANIIKGSQKLAERLGEGMHKGMTASCAGFYAPQGRILRYDLKRTDMIQKLHTFSHNNLKVTNFEMETGAMYGLARVLGHECCSVNAIVANRINLTHSHKAHETMLQLIETVLDRLAK